MKVAVSAAGKNLESIIDERFGRSRYFIILETDDMRYEVIEGDLYMSPAPRPKHQRVSLNLA